MNRGIPTLLRKGCATCAASLLLVTIGAAPAALAQTTQAAASPAVTHFHCNADALSPSERAFHQHLTKRLLASRTDVAELPKGYELQFSPDDVSVADVAQWVVAEEKCCPFFYFHIDLEKQGTLVCLGLTGPEGVKPFIRSEFNIPEPK
jgi:hypothetical protein